MTLKYIKNFIPYFLIIFVLAVIGYLVRNIFSGWSSFAYDSDFQLFILGGILFISYFINRIAPRTIIPSFVWAIFAGMAMQPMLGFMTKDISILKIVMEVFAAIILFSGGLDVPFKNFKRWFFPIVSLSLIGLLISAAVFSVILILLAKLFGIFNIFLLPSIFILGAALASTDPTAIIPTLSILRFKKNFLKQIAVSESALTDISGSVLTRFLILAIISVPLVAGSTAFSFLSPLLKKSVYDALALQIISGIIVGYLGFYLIKKFYNQKGNKIADPALLLSVPIFTYVLGNVLGGAGFLAAFISGLFSDVTPGLNKALHFYDDLLNHLIKPFIFIILGALVPFAALIKFAPIGIISAIIFMFVIRPLTVFISLAPWFKTFHFRDLLFLSFVRETGIIAAILLIIASSYNVIASDFVIAVGMWVILFTLMVEPPLTPLFVEKIGVAKRVG